MSSRSKKSSAHHGSNTSLASGTAAAARPTSASSAAPSSVPHSPAAPPAVATARSPTPVHAAATAGAPHASSSQAATAMVAAAAAPPTGMVGAKARRLAKEEAERAAKQEAEDLVSMASYNSMLKGLLSKEIHARELAQAESAATKEQLQRLQEETREQGQEQQARALAEQAIVLRATLKAEHDAKVEALVAERVKEARSKDAVKYRDLNDIQTKLHVEFEDKYAQRFQRVERDKRELAEKLALALHRLDGLSVEHKAAQAKAQSAEGLVRALEHRVAYLEKFKSRLNSFRNIVKYMTCRVFINSVRLKRALHGVYDSLRMLHEKLTYDEEYDRTSECILPQHELEVWLKKTHGLLMKNKEKERQQFQQLFAGTSQQFVHPNTLVTEPTMIDKNKVNTSTTASGAESAKGPLSPANKSSGSSVAASLPPSGTPSAGPTSPGPPLSPSGRIRKRGMSINAPNANMQTMVVGGKGGEASASGEATGKQHEMTPTAADSPSATKSSFPTVKNPFAALSAFAQGASASSFSFSNTSSVHSLGGVGVGGPPTPLGPTLNFRAMLYAISEVELVLRGCLIECLSKAAEWKASSEDFFARNQELVQEAAGMKDDNRRLTSEVKQLSSALGVLEKTLQLREEEKKALREIDAQAPGNTNSGSSSNAAGGGGGGGGQYKYSTATTMKIGHPTSASSFSSGGGYSAGVQKRLIEKTSQQSDTHLHARLQPSSGGDVIHQVQATSAEEKALAMPSHSHPDHTRAPSNAHAVDAKTLALMGAHDRKIRLSHLDGSSSAQLAALSALDLAEMMKTRGGPHSGGLKGPKGFFDHHNALMKCVLVQKQQLEAAQRNEAILRQKLGAYKDKLARLQQGNAAAWKMAETMDGELDGKGDEEEEDEKEARRQQDQDDEPPTSSLMQEEKQPEQPPLRSPRERDAPSTIAAARVGSQTARARVGGASGGRPQQLDLDYADESRTLRATIPFSPPVFPVSPYAPHHQRPHSSAGHATSSGSSRGTTPRGPALTMTIPNLNGAPLTAATTPASPYDSNPRSRTQSAAEVRPSAGGQLLLSTLLSHTQPIPSSPGASTVIPRPSTSSSSYAGTSIYAPLGVALFQPGSYAQAHASNRGPERVYGGAPIERPRTSSGVGSARGETSGALTARELHRPRTVNPLLQAGLASASVVAAALTAADAHLHPSLQVTGDVRYDILSPYTAQPLPWERREPRAPSALSIAAANPTPPTGHTVSTMEARRQRERKAAVPRQARSPSREEADRAAFRQALHDQKAADALDAQQATDSLIRELDASIASPSSALSPSPPRRSSSRPTSGGHHAKALGSLAAPPPVRERSGREQERDERTYAEAGEKWRKAHVTVPQTSAIPPEIAVLLEQPARAAVEKAIVSAKKTPIAAPPPAAPTAALVGGTEWDAEEEFDRSPSASTKHRSNAEDVGEVEFE